MNSSPKDTRPLFWTAFVLGLALRLMALVFGGTGAQEDGVTRLDAAIRWAEDPRWLGLSGIWPALPTYLLGALIRLWDRPLLWARLLSLGASIAAIFALRNGVTRLWGAAAGELSAAFLALHWFFIVLVSAFWVEPLYLGLVLIALERLSRVEEEQGLAAAAVAGGLIALAMFCRHEGGLVWIGALIWLRVKGRRRAAAVFSVLPALALAYHLVAPLLSGAGIFDLLAEQSAMRAREVTRLGHGRWRGLGSWLLLPAAIPSFVVLLPAAVGLRRRGRRALGDLFVIHALVQLLPFFVLTLTVAWLPKLRYLTLYLVGLFPLCALGWITLASRTRRPKLCLALGLAAMMGVQAFAWSRARAARGDALGFLPVDWPAASQPLLEARLQALMRARTQATIVSLGEGPPQDPWGLTGARVADPELRRRSRALILGSYGPELKPDAIPGEVWEAELILIDPAGPLYERFFAERARRASSYEIRRLSPHLEAWSRPGQ